MQEQSARRLEREITRNMIYKQHREIETSLSLVLCCLFSYSKISKRLEGVAYKLLLINHTACTLRCTVVFLPCLNRGSGRAVIPHL